MGYRQIMVPLDGSLLAEYILPHVEEVAKAHDSRVTLIHVVPTGGASEDDLTQSQKDTRAHISEYLTKTSGELGKKGLDVNWVRSSP